MMSNIILRSMAKIAIKYENIVPHSSIFCTSILKVQLYTNGQLEFNAPVCSISRGEVFGAMSC